MGTHPRYIHSRLLGNICGDALSAEITPLRRIAGGFSSTQAKSERLEQQVAHYQIGGLLACESVTSGRIPVTKVTISRGVVPGGVRMLIFLRRTAKQFFALAKQAWPNKVGEVFKYRPISGRPHGRLAVTTAMPMRNLLTFSLDRV